MDDHDQPIRALDACDKSALWKALESFHLRPVAQIEDDDGSLMVRLHFKDVGVLQSLNQLFLGISFKFVRELSEKLNLENGLKFRLDATHYAGKFESAMLRLENLTAHQAEVYEKLKNKTRIDLRAPAGEEIIISRVRDDRRCYGLTTFAFPPFPPDRTIRCR